MIKETQPRKRFREIAGKLLGNEQEVLRAFPRGEETDRIHKELVTSGLDGLIRQDTGLPESPSRIFVVAESTTGDTSVQPSLELTLQYPLVRDELHVNIDPATNQITRSVFNSGENWVSTPLPELRKKITPAQTERLLAIFDSATKQTQPITEERITALREEHKRLKQGQ